MTSDSEGFQFPGIADLYASVIPEGQGQQLSDAKVFTNGRVYWANPIPQFYISAKVRDGENQVQEVAEFLEGNGWQWTFDWRKCEINKPYLDPRYIANNQQEAMAMVNGIMTADLFVLIGNDYLVGAYVEMGVALGYQVPTAIIAPTKQSVFFAMPTVAVFDTFEQFTKNYVGINYE